MTSDFIDWKRHPITQEVFLELNTRIEGLKEELSYGAGIDPLLDSYKRGAIQALRDIISMELEESQ